MFIFFFCLLIYHPIGEQIVSKSLKVIQMEKKKRKCQRLTYVFEEIGHGVFWILIPGFTCLSHFYLMAKNVPLLNYDWNEWCFQFVSEPVSTGNNK